MTPNLRKFTVVIADDHQIVRTGLRMALEAHGIVEPLGLHIVAEAATGLEAIEVVKVHKPDLLLLDISMPLASGAEILLDVRRWSPDTKIVVLTAVTSRGLLAGLMETGLDGLFAKGSDNAILFEKLPMILRGAKFVEDQLLALIKDAPEDTPLSPRERQTLTMIVAGRTNKEVADLMGISPKTAEKHRGSLMQKLNVTSIATLMAKALRDGLIEDETFM